jgi:hypothetical protein
MSTGENRPAWSIYLGECPVLVDRTHYNGIQFGPRETLREDDPPRRHFLEAWRGTNDAYGGDKASNPPLKKVLWRHVQYLLPATYKHTPMHAHVHTRHTQSHTCTNTHIHTHTHTHMLSPTHQPTYFLPGLCRWA